MAYVTSKGDAHNGMRITIGGMKIVFSPAYDPTSLRTDVAGKLVKKLVEDGSTVKKGELYCEIEVMKMFMPLNVTESGVLSWCNNEGAALGPGDLLTTLVLENPESVTTSTDFEGDLKVHGWGKLSSGISNNRLYLMLRDILHDGVSGYALSESNIQRAMDIILVTVIDPSLPKYEIDEQLSILSGRIDAIYTLRKANKDNHAHVLEICQTHFQLSSTSTIIVKIIDAIADGNKIHNMMGTNVTNLREGR